MIQTYDIDPKLRKPLQELVFLRVNMNIRLEDVRCRILAYYLFIFVSSKQSIYHHYPLGIKHNGKSNI